VSEDFRHQLLHEHEVVALYQDKEQGLSL